MKTKEILILAVVVVLFVVAPWASQSAFAGYVVIWGDVDVNEPNDPNEPYPLDSNDYVAIGSGSHHTLAIKSDGSLVGLYYSLWGNSDGQCDVPEGNDFVKVDGGNHHSVAVRSDGSLIAWGNNNHGQCNFPTGNDFIDVVAGSKYNVALKSDGSLIAWGYKHIEDSNAPQSGEPPAGYDFVDIAAGQGHSLSLRSVGSLAAWGQNFYGECNVPESNDFMKIAAGRSYSLAVKKDGSLIAWGRNHNGQCDVPEGNDFVDVAAGWYHSLAIKDDGSVVAWGRNNNGQCNVPDGNDFVAIAAGSEHSMALTSDAVNILTMSTIPAGLDCIIPGQGEHGYYLGQGVFINAPRCPNCPDVYKFDHWTGDITEPNLTFGHLIMDKDRTITAVYVADERLCGDECHPILQGDVNEDCYINFVDFALYAQRWMSCTHPDCD